MAIVVNVIENPDGMIEFWVTDFQQPLHVPKPKKHKHELFADTLEEGYAIAFEILDSLEWFPGIKDMPMVLDLRGSQPRDQVVRIPVVVDENEYRGPIISAS